MNLNFVSRKTLSLTTLFAAGTLVSIFPAVAEETARPAYDVGSEADLRKYLNETQPDSDTGNDSDAGSDSGETTEKKYYDNADLTLTGSFTVDTHLQTDTDESGEETTSGGSIEVLASGSALIGGGNTIATTGEGDLFYLSDVAFSVSGVTFSSEAGSDGENAETGRVITTANGGLATTVDIGAGTTFENRFLNVDSADALPNYLARGGAIVSAQILDVIRLSGDEGETVTFSGNTVRNALSDDDYDLNAAGGAVFTSGLFSVSGSAETSFLNNSAISLHASAFGGAIFVSNARLNADGSSSSTVYPDSITEGAELLDFGLQVESAEFLYFGENSAEAAAGSTAQGGAVAVSGGYFDATGTEEAKTQIVFFGNIAKISAPEDADAETTSGSTVGGGALLVCDAGRVTFDAYSTLILEYNRAVGGAELSTVAGGALVVSDATVSLAGTTEFLHNFATAERGGSTVYGGAAYFYGTLSEDADGNEVNSSSISLSGNLSFAKNKAEANALSSGTTESSAYGGALALAGAEVDASALTSLSFYNNWATSKTFAAGGALASISESSVANFASAGDLSFSENTVWLSELEEGETQNADVTVAGQGGAIYMSAGTLSLSTTIETSEVVFEKNRVWSYSQEGTSAQGGAIYISAGTLTVGSAATFSANETASHGTTGTAQGGAAYFAGGTTDFSGETTFSENLAVGAIAQGGAIYSADGEATFSAATTFSENSANTGGGTFDAGNAFARGGAIFAESAGTLTFSEATTFSQNEATITTKEETNADGKKSGAAGGAIYSAGTLTFSSAEFTRNKVVVDGDEAGAAFGGAMYLAGGVLSAESISMVENSAEAQGEADGGALYISSGTLDVSGDLSFSENSVSSSTAAGGAIYSTGTARIAGTFSAENNEATATGDVYGGAIAARAGTFSVSGSGDHALTGNAATSTDGNAYGGAIYAAAGFKTTAGTLEISDNAATSTDGNAYGGAIFLRGGTIELTNATLTDNAATSTNGNAYGGAIFLDASSNVASNLVFSGNTIISGNTANGENDGIFVGVADAAGTARTEVYVTFSADADLSTNEDGTTARENVETATVEDKITVADGAAFTLRKTGAGDLSLAEIAVEDGSEFNLEIAGGNATLTADVAAATSLSVSSGATLSVSSGVTFAGYSEATLAGTLNVAGTFAFSDASTATLTGTLAFEDGSLATIGSAATVSGAGVFSVSGNVNFSASAETANLTVDALSVGAGTLTLDDLTLSVAKNIIFTETGDATITLNNATLAVTEISRAADGVNATIDGTGTLIVYAAADSGDDDETPQISFPEFYETLENEDGSESEELRAGSFTIGKNIVVKAGISVGEGVTLKMDAGSQIEGARNILLSGGTLIATGAETAESAFLMETFTVAASDEISVLGDGETTQYFKMAEVSTETPDEGDDGSAAETTVNAMSLAGTLEITENTTFIGDVSLTSGSELTGAGTVDGDISGAGTLSLAQINGDVSVANGSTITAAGTVNVNGNVFVGSADSSSANAVFSFAEDANFSSTAFCNYGRVNASTATFASGTFTNTGRLSVRENATLTFASGTVFASVADSVIDISAAGSAIRFADGATVVDIANATVEIDATTLAADSALGIFGLSEEDYAALTIVDVNDRDLVDRFVWDSVSETLVFLGLNGEAFTGTLYGDLQREGLVRTYDLMDAVLRRASTRTLKPQIYGENKRASRYMSGYLEKQRQQRGGEVAAAAEARSENALSEKLNASLTHFWFQTDYSSSRQSARKGFDAYDADIFNGLVGVSTDLGKWELGGALSAGEEHYRMNASGTRHKVESSAYGIAGYAVYSGEVFDWTLGAAGMYADSESTRGEYSGDFDRWQLGAMTEIGATLRAQNWWTLRAFTGIACAYVNTGSVDETGGNGALEIASENAFGARASLGVSSAFAVSDALQFTFRWAGTLDLGDRSFELDAYMPATRTSYIIESREYESLGMEAGAYLNWAFSENFGVYGGYTGSVRAGERTHSVGIGVNFFF